MILRNVQFVGEEGEKEIRLHQQKIHTITNCGQLPANQIEEQFIDLNNAIAFPGLINSHDHLDFNLFPLLGNCVYNNYTEWGKDIHDNDKDTIDGILKIPQQLRMQWGMYKNLLNGVTTVVNHGEKLPVTESFISVFQDCHSLHSIAFEKNWKYKLNGLFDSDQLYVMHVGEGTDELARQEINTLIKWNLFKRSIVGVHAVAMDEKDAAHFKAIVWCPASNLYLLSQTAAVDKLKHQTAILFGTDSTLTAGWNIWEQLRLARNFHTLTDEELFASVTKTAADVWGLASGKLKEGLTADIVVANKKETSSVMDAFYSLNPEDILLVIKSGKIVLFDESLRQQLLQKELVSDGFSEVFIGGAKKQVAGDLPCIGSSSKQYHSGVQFPFEYELSV
jgi:cytosine/adenosine deaminase-related metal-dependent hydrolase